MSLLSMTIAKWQEKWIRRNGYLEPYGIDLASEELRRGHASSHIL